MPHVRESIMAAVEDALTGLTIGATELQVFRSHAFALDDTQLPALEIEQGNEIVDDQNVHGILDRQFEFTVTAEVKQNDGYATAVNAACLAVEEALAADQTLGGLAQDVVIRGTEMEVSGEGEKPVARATMTFIASYTTSREEPDVPL